MIRFVICEDKKTDLERANLAVNRAMASYDIDYRISRFNELNNDLEKFISTNTDSKIYILDIELNETSGIEIASRIRENDWESYIIFVTSHPECKNDVFQARVMAIDYISKFNTYEKRLEETILEIIQNIDKQKVLEFSFSSTKYRVPLNKITYIEKEPFQRRCIIHTEDGTTYPYVITVGELLNKLSPNFYQSHQSGIVNKNKIKAVDFTNNMITLFNDETITLLSDRKKKGLKDYADIY